MFRKLEVRVNPLTPEFTLSFREYPMWEGDRSAETPTGQSRVTWLRHLVYDQLFCGVHWVLATLDGVVYRINGNRSSTMLISLPPADFPQGLWATVDYYVCESRWDMIQLYSQLDSQLSARSTTDTARAQRLITPTLRNVPAGAFVAATNGIACSIARVESKRVLTSSERLQLAHAYVNFMLWAGQYAGHRKFRSVGTVAAMFDTFQRSPELARDFWDRVAHPVQAQTPATSALSEFLSTSTAPRAPGRRWDFRAFYCKSIIAANAWMTGTNTQLQYIPSAPLTPLRWPQE